MWYSGRHSPPTPAWSAGCTIRLPFRTRVLSSPSTSLVRTPSRFEATSKTRCERSVQRYCERGAKSHSVTNSATANGPTSVMSNSDDTRIHLQITILLGSIKIYLFQYINCRIVLPMDVSPAFACFTPGPFVSRSRPLTTRYGRGGIRTRPDGFARSRSRTASGPLESLVSLAALTNVLAPLTEGAGFEPREACCTKPCVGALPLSHPSSSKDDVRRQETSGQRSVSI